MVFQFYMIFIHLRSKYKNKFVGNIHDLTTFSFDPVKTFTAIDGGLIVCKNKSQSKN